MSSDKVLSEIARRRELAAKATSGAWRVTGISTADHEWIADCTARRSGELDVITEAYSEIKQTVAYLNSSGPGTSICQGSKGHSDLQRVLTLIERAILGEQNG